MTTAARRPAHGGFPTVDPRARDLIANCPTPMYHDTHRYCPSCPWTEDELGPSKPTFVYVASSWRCQMQQAVIHTLRAAKIDCYDFRNPPNGTGFAWQEVMPTFDINAPTADMHEYLAALDHPRSVEGFNADFEAMQRADAFVLVLPCGRSAHLELGWAVGAGKRTAILLDPHLGTGEVTPELMYKMVDFIAPSMFELLGWLGVDD